MSKTEGRKRPPRQASEPPDLSVGRWLDLQPLWLLHARLQGKRPRNRVLPVQLVIRDSTGPARR